MLLSADRLDFEVIRFGAYLAAAAQEIKKTRSGEKSKLKLMAAATRVLENVSYRDLLVESVCQEAGVAKGTFYIYFASKDIFLKELARGYVNFEIQTYPRLSSKNTAFANTLKCCAVSFRWAPSTRKCVTSGMTETGASSIDR
jgi:hypothetical protein